VLESWFGVFAPAGTPAAIIKALNAATETALTDPGLRDNFTKNSLEAMGGPPEALGTLARADSEKYARLVKELKITAGAG
jgi:tripartite-type tricarboxylate transporter receptor subunit TctC